MKLLSKTITRRFKDFQLLPKTVQSWVQVRPSDRVRLKNANYVIFSGQIVLLERPIMR